MFRLWRSRNKNTAALTLEALGRSQAIVEFDPDGIVLTANQKFLDTFGYTLAEIKGKHHRLFVEAGHAASADNQQFWQNLRQGQYQAAQFKRIGKGGRVVWIQASYNVILDLNGKPFKVVKFATDVTPEVVLLNNLKAIVDQNFSEIDHALSHSGDQAQIAAGAVKNTSDGVSTMAASAEEMASSVRQIADTMTKSKIAVERAHQQLAGADQAIQRFSVMSVAMAGIVGLIRDIAAQINLLALNATIESARAGDAGKGFAVVASEVKNLANQAGNATDKIASEIESLQMVADETIAVLQAIGSSINSVLEYVTATADAVEEQSVVSQEMSAAMQETAGTVTAINDNMVQISASVQQVGLAVDRTRSAAQILVK